MGYLLASRVLASAAWNIPCICRYCCTAVVQQYCFCSSVLSRPTTLFVVSIPSDPFAFFLRKLLLHGHSGSGHPSAVLGCKRRLLDIIATIVGVRIMEWWPQRRTKVECFLLFRVALDVYLTNATAPNPALQQQYQQHQQQPALCTYRRRRHSAPGGK